jgi:hypothetical protein
MYRRKKSGDVPLGGLTNLALNVGHAQDRKKSDWLNFNKMAATAGDDS